MYFNRTPNIIIRLFPRIIWKLPNDDNKIFLTFDDGPHPEITPWILAQLKQYNAKATFFCLGKNAEKYPEIIAQILKDGHKIGNHGYAHLNGWKTNDEDYLEDVIKSEKILKQVQHDKLLFRPPYGRIKSSQISRLKPETSIINWTLMPGDFDQNISSEKCFINLTNNIKSGDIIVLHDNEKSWKHLEYCLPKWLELLKKQKFEFGAISL